MVDRYTKAVLTVIAVSLAVLAILTLVPSLAMAADSATIDKTVSACVSAVHAIHPSFQRFDAFYNAGTGRVENNAVYVADQDALYNFNKCMAQHGIPLGPK